MTEKFAKKRYVQRAGTKQSIVFELLDKIKEHCTDKSFTFVDLFGGGGAVSANATYYYDKVIYNEINKGVYDLFLAVQDDGFLEKMKEIWVDREEFMKIKNEGYKNNEENLILTAWSFGNNRISYIYGKHTEERKKYIHKIIFSKSEEEYKQNIKHFNDNNLGYFNKDQAEWVVTLPDDDWKQFNKSENKRIYKFGKNSVKNRFFIKGIASNNTHEKEGNWQLQSLERLERLESLQSLERLERYNIDYRSVVLPHPSQCVIYLDPPYRNTGGYETSFDHNGFDKYVFFLKENGYTIFVSEYNLPYGEVIWQKEKRSFISTKDTHKSIEKLYKI